MVGCWRCTYPSIRFFPLKITVGCPRCCGVLFVHEGVVSCCVVWCVAWCVWCVVLVVVWCVCCVGGECCVVFLFSVNSLRSLSCSLFFLLLSFFLSSCPLLFSLFSLLSSLFSSRHQTVWKESINQHNGQLRGIWMSSRFSPSPSPLPPPFSPSPPQKRDSLLQEYFRRRNYFSLQFSIVSENRRRVKLVITDLN